MIDFTKTILNNGLRVIIHQDSSTPMAAFNLLYDAGSADENPDKTGTAHFLEHLMFGGTPNIPYYDREVQKAGGENNAFTSNDITNYYIHLPAVNVETAFWLESDRMADLVLTEKGFETQKNVVIEEFKQRYINQPYGDIWMLLRPLAYKVHPYRWPTIGREISHIENITMDEIKNFFYENYCPSNAILSITGNVDVDKCIKLADKWFGLVKKRKKARGLPPAEPPQKNPEKLEVYRDVPSHMIILAFHMDRRDSREFYICDLISDLLSGGKSSRLYRHLVMEKKSFSSINAYITGDKDPGLFIITGRLMDDVTMNQGHEEILKEINGLLEYPPQRDELDKVRNKLEATRQYTHSDILHKATDLAFYELTGDAGKINDEITEYLSITTPEITETAGKLFDQTNSSTLLYHSNQKPRQS
ncbi:MAG: M16 family metallopeptidase [Bacteroidales bacterium]